MLLRVLRVNSSAVLLVDAISLKDWQKAILKDLEIAKRT
jgi:hypothetical protein